MQIATPNGEVIDTQLDWWQIRFCFYMSQHAGLGRGRPIQQLLLLNKDDSLFSGAVARTYKDAYNGGYNDCLEELCK